MAFGSPCCLRVLPSGRLWNIIPLILLGMGSLEYPCGIPRSGFWGIFGNPREEDLSPYVKSQYQTDLDGGLWRHSRFGLLAVFVTCPQTVVQLRDCSFSHFSVMTEDPS